MSRHKCIESFPEDIKVSEDRIRQCDYVFCILERDGSLRVVCSPIPENSQLVNPYCEATIQDPLPTHLRDCPVQCFPWMPCS